MEFKKLIIGSSVLVTMNAWAVGSIDCNLPCGPEELITCAAQAVGVTAKNYYNTVLFSTGNLDGFCSSPLSPTATGLQTIYYNSYCGTQKGSYFSYENFIAGSQGFFNKAQQTGFACEATSSKQVRYKELSNFLTTIAQETTSVASGYTNDGLYFRYENGWLLGNDLQYKTPYYNQAASFSVAQVNAGTNTWTQNLWQPDPTNGAQTYYFHTPPVEPSYPSVKIQYVGGWPIVMPEGYTEKLLVDETVLYPGLWVGMGAKQLTADSMFAFYAYYYQQLATPTADSQDFSAFVNRFLVDGQLGFTGAFWYWMYRVNGNTSGPDARIPIHKIVTNHAKPVCQDIATVTRMVNGGCNNYDPGRLTYYRYFNSQFSIPTTPIIVEVDGKTLNSLVCNLDLQLYCETA